MEHDMRRIKSFLMIMTPMLATAAIAETNQLPTGALDTEEKYAEFWSEVVETDFEIGACAFSLGAIASANSNYIIRAVDTRLEDSEPFRVGEFTMHRQDVAYTFEPVTFSNADDNPVHILINSMTLMRVEGVAEFDGGATAHLSAHLYISNTENMTTGEVTQELQRTFVPNFVGEDGRSRRDGTRQRNGLVSSINQADTDVEPCNRFWTKCVDQFGYCDDKENCWIVHKEEFRQIQLELLECMYWARNHLSNCIYWCEVKSEDPQCSVNCQVRYGSRQAECLDYYTTKMTESQLFFKFCLEYSKANNSAIHPGCDCPEGMIPFPNQKAPNWGDVPCHPVYPSIP